MTYFCARSIRWTLSRVVLLSFLAGLISQSAQALEARSILDVGSANPLFSSYYASQELSKQCNNPDISEKVESFRRDYPIDNTAPLPSGINNKNPFDKIMHQKLLQASAAEYLRLAPGLEKKLLYFNPRPFDPEYQLTYPTTCAGLGSYEQEIISYLDEQKIEIDSLLENRQILGDKVIDKMMDQIIVSAIESQLIRKLLVSGEWKKRSIFSLSENVPLLPIYPLDFESTQAGSPEERLEMINEYLPIFRLNHATPTGEVSFVDAILAKVFSNGVLILQDDDSVGIFDRNQRGADAFNQMAMVKINQRAFEIFNSETTDTPDYLDLKSEDSARTLRLNRKEMVMIEAIREYLVGEFQNDLYSVLTASQRMNFVKYEMHQTLLVHYKSWITTFNKTIAKQCEAPEVNLYSPLLMWKLFSKSIPDQFGLFGALCHTKTRGKWEVATHQELGGGLALVGGLIGKRLLGPLSLGVAVVGGAVYVKSFVDRATLSYGIAMLEDSLLVGEKSYRHEYHVLSSNYTVGAILAGSALGFGSVATFAKNRIGWRRVIGYRFNDSGQVVFCKWKLASIIGFMTQPIAIDAFTFIQNGKNPLHSSLFAVNTISQVINSVFLAEVFSARRMGSIIQKIGTSSLVSLLLNFYSQGLLSVLKKGDIDPKITQFQLIGRGVIASAEQLVIVPMLAAVRMNHPLLATTLEQVNGTRGSYFNSHIRIHYVEDDMDFLSAYVRAIKTSLHWSVADDIVLSNEELAAAHEILRAYVKDNPGSLPKEQIYGRLVLGQKINESLL